MDRKRICSICRSANNSVLPGISVRELTETLFIDLKEALHEKCSVCCKCVKQIRNAYDFKMQCLCKQENIMPNHSTDIETNNSKIICWLCKYGLKENSGISLTQILETKNLKAIFEKHIPELDLQATGEPKICPECQKCLTNFTKLLECIQDIEQSKCMIKQRPANLFWITEQIKTEKRFVSTNFFQKVSNASNGNAVNKINVIKCDKCNFESECLSAYQKHRNFVHTELHHCPCCTFSTPIISFLHSHLNRHSIADIENSKEAGSNVIGQENYIHECELCNFQTFDIVELKVHVDQHM